MLKALHFHFTLYIFVSFPGVEILNGDVDEEVIRPGRGGGLSALEDEMGGYIRRGLLLLILGEEKREAGFASVVVVVVGVGEGGRGRGRSGWGGGGSGREGRLAEEEGGRSDLKEREKEEEEESWMGRGKEKEMSLPSFKKGSRCIAFHWR